VKTAHVTASVRRVRETLDPSVPALIHAEWVVEMPWVVQGTTTRGTDRTFDLGLFSEGSAADAVRANWIHLLAATGMRAARHARQVHTVAPASIVTWGSASWTTAMGTPPASPGRCWR
jgi:hypothetical protein